MTARRASPPPSRVLAVLVALAAVLTVMPAPAAAQSPPSSPSAGQFRLRFGNCDILVRWSDQIGSTRSDGQQIAQRLEEMLTNSADMRVKVQRACDRNTQPLTIDLFRGNHPSGPALGAEASTQRPVGKIGVNLDHIDRITGALSGDPRAIPVLASSFLTSLLAHEFDHLGHREDDPDTPTDESDPHLDPPGRTGATGPAVDDENTVNQDLNTGKTRLNYVDDFGDGRPKAAWVVDITVNDLLVPVPVFLDFDEWARQVSRTTGPAPPRPRETDTGRFGAIPDRPCGGGQPGAGCWQEATAGDGDLDGVPDGGDNCPDRPNPQQADTDRDGQGDGCDPDGDGDGHRGALETAAGASDMDAASTPQHWSIPGTCSGTADRDGDGLAPSEDVGCTLPPPISGTVPDLLGLGSVPEHHRPDRGGIPLGSVPTSVDGVVVLTDPDGATHEVPVRGTVALEHGRTTQDDDGRRRVPVEIVALSLSGETGELGPVRVRERPGAVRSGTLTGGEDAPLPGRLELPVELRVDVPEHAGPLVTPDPAVLASPDQVAHLPYGVALQGSDAPMILEGERPWRLEQMTLQAPEAAVRVAGPTRAHTAARVAALAAAGGAGDAVVLARQGDYPDALASGPLARILDAPVLLTSQGSLDEPARAEIERLDPSLVVLVGGTAALSEAVAAEVTESGREVTRVAGRDRFETAAQIATVMAGLGVDTSRAYVAEGADPDPGRGWPDALAVSGLAAFQRRPILLVTTEQVPAATAQGLEEIGARELTLVGGTAAVSAATAEQLAAGGASVQRIAGTTRYDTSARLAARALEAGMSAARVWLATGRNWPDALVAGPAAGRDGSILLLVDGAAPAGSPETLTWLRSVAAQTTALYLLGGEAALSRATAVAAAEAAT